MTEESPSTDLASSTPGAGGAPEPDATSAGQESRGDPPTPAELHALNAALAKEFPVAIDATELVLMDVDPTCLHAFWGVMPSDLEAMDPALDARTTPAMVLRLYDVTPARFGHADRARPVDIDIEGLQGNRYIDHLEPGKSYVAELGRVGTDGTLSVIAESNTLLMPGVASPFTSWTPEAIDETGPEPPVSRPLDSRPAAGPSHLDPVFPNPGQSEPWKSLSLLPSGSREDVRPAQAVEVGAAHPAADRSPPPAPGGPTTHHPPDFAGDPSPPAWSGLTPGLGSWSSFASYSSGDLARPETDLELTVELLVRGRTRPGGRLSLFGRPVAIGPDGRFSIRQRLPDGLLPLALVLGHDAPVDDGER